MFMYLHSMTTHLSALIAPLNTNNSDNTNIFLAHGSHRSHGSLFAAGRSQFLEHEIRRRTTDRREVITRITRILFAHGSHSHFSSHSIFCKKALGM